MDTVGSAIGGGNSGRIERAGPVCDFGGSVGIPQADVDVSRRGGSGGVMGGLGATAAGRLKLLGVAGVVAPNTGKEDADDVLAVEAGRRSGSRDGAGITRCDGAGVSRRDDGSVSRRAGASGAPPARVAASTPKVPATESQCECSF